MGRKTIIVIAACLAVVLLGALVGVFVLAPNVARNAIEERLTRVADRSGLTVKTGTIETMGLKGARILDLTLHDGEVEILRVDLIEADANAISVLRGNRNLDSVRIQGVKLRLELDDSGLPILLERLRSKLDDNESTDAASEGSRLDQIPELLAEDVEVTFISPDPDFPISLALIPKSGWSWDGERLKTHAKVDFPERDNNPNFEIPPSLTMDITFDRNFRPLEGGLEFEGRLAISGLGPLPFLKGGFTGVKITDAGGIQALGLSLKHAEQDLFSMNSVEVRAESMGHFKRREIKELIIDQPILFLDFDATGSGPLMVLHDVLRQPAARGVVSSARSFAENITAKRQEPSLDPFDEEPSDVPASEESESNDELEVLFRRLPELIRITNATVKGTDLRNLPVTNRAKDFSLDDGNFELVNRISEGDFEVRGAFRASSGLVPRGNVDIDLVTKVLQKSVKGSVQIDGLDLSWVGQVLGPRFADKVRGGTLRAKMEFNPGTSPLSFSMKGLVSVDQLSLFHPAVAEDIIDGITASYTFDALYDGRMELPAPRLALVPPYKDETGPDGVKRPSRHPKPRGGFVVKAGKAEFNKVNATFRPAIYGFNAPGKWPARFDLTIELLETPIQNLIDSVPRTIQGPIFGTKINGTLAWNFGLEVPMYRASDMNWNTTPVLKGVELVHIPEPVDVRKLMTPMSLTITDSIKEEDDFSKTVRLGAPTPTPADWLMENAKLTLEQIDERARRRGWPPLPTAERSGLRYEVLESPEYWVSRYALSQTAPKPWSDFDTIVRREDAPYGPYVFVPLAHISPYLPRAVMTTEDSSFFTNSGFNTHALKASIEQNLSHSAFKRGASTIAMQMVKNVFLDRKKLIVRKIREAFLVFLMETVVDVPKERIMEVYLNVIEFGPGIFGIHEASLHYFGKRPDELTLGEVAWFASIIPSPKRYHVYWDRGRITDAYFNRMKRYMQVMYNRERITAEELAEGTQAPPEFYKPDKTEPVLRPKAAPMVPVFSPFDPDMAPPTFVPTLLD